MQRARRSKRPSRQMPYLLTAALVITALVLWLLAPLKLRTEYLALVTTFLGAISGVVQLANVVYQRRTSSSQQLSTNENLKQAVDQLCANVRITAEELRRNLQVKAEVLDVTWVTVRSGPADVPKSGNISDLVREFSRLPTAKRRLLILGAPASGKTVYATLLVLGIIKNRGGSGMAPVLLRYALRDNFAERDVVEWITDQIERDYSSLVRDALFNSGQSPVVPVLDGIDEVGPLLPRALTELEEELQESAPLVLVCRSDLYREAVKQGGSDISNVWTIELRPLDAQAVVNYLGTDPRSQEVAAEITRKPLSTLSVVLRNPFNAWLAKLLYQDAATNALAGVDNERELQRRLLANFIPSVMSLTKRHPRERFVFFTPAASTRWLRFLARFLRRHDEDDMAWWQLRRMTPPYLAEAVSGMVAGLAFGGILLLLEKRATGLGIGALFGVFFGVAFCLAYMSTWRRGSTEQRSGGGGFRDNASPYESMRRLSEGLVTVAIAWLVASALVAWFGDIRSLAIGGLVQTVAVVCVGVVVAFLAGAVVGGIAAGLLRVMTSYAALATVRATTPHEALARDRRATAVCYLMFAVIIGLITGSSLAVVSSDFWLIALAAAGGGPVGGITAVMMFFAWPAYQARHAWLALLGRLPWRYMTFLRVTREAGVLRQSGAHYQFRHRILRDFLAE